MSQSSGYHGRPGYEFQVRDRELCEVIFARHIHNDVNT